jgi:S-adenosylmethionine:tRNA ribosyltransferase-isomerase
VDVALFDYQLPPTAIAQQPASPRDAARLLRLPAAAGFSHHHVYELDQLLRPGDLLVVNDSKVLAARLEAHKPSQGRVELLLIEPIAGSRWKALLGASHAPRVGVRLTLPGGWSAVLEDGPNSGGEVVIQIDGPGSVETLLAQHGRVPLPPYIKRDQLNSVGARRPEASDRESYQTLFAVNPGAIAAPTAGLHFTPELMSRLSASGISWATLTLHVGWGTFAPIKVADTAAIELHSERYELPPATVQAVHDCRDRGGRVIAVGTTTVRVLESCVAPGTSQLRAGAGRTELFIAPGFSFRIVDGLLTNFHLPKSSLLMLVAAMAGRERVLAAYRAAIEAGYRFYSYGDAMLIEPVR